MALSASSPIIFSPNLILALASDNLINASNCLKVIATLPLELLALKSKKYF